MNVIREWDYTIDNLPEKISIKDKSVSLEIGCGNGLFLSTIASIHPENVYIGLEIKGKCISLAKKKCARLIETKQIIDDNIILIQGDAFTAIDKFFKEESINDIYINFPDPWFKQRHLKKRIINSYTIVKYAKILKRGGHIYFVTDNLDYRDYAINVFITSNLFESLFRHPYYVEDLEWYPISLYEQKWRAQGRLINYSSFIKK